MQFLPSTRSLLSTESVPSSAVFVERLLTGLGRHQRLDAHDIAKHLPKDASEGAEFLASMFPNQISHNEETKTWYIWNGIVHEPLMAASVPNQLIDVLGTALRDSFEELDGTVREYSKTMTEEKGKEFRDLVKRLTSDARDYMKELRSNRSVKSTLDKLARLVAKTSDHFDDDRRWFVVENGVYDMDAVRRDRRFDLLPHDPARPVFRYWRLREQVGAQAPALQKFLTESIADKTQADYLGRVLSVACMGATHARTVVSLQGERNSGKSMFNRVLEKFGPDHFAAPPRGAIVSGSRAPEHDRYKMRKARFVSFLEITDKLDREFFLKYSGGDECTSEEKYIVNRPWKPQGIIFMTSNYGPTVDRTDGAVFERLAPINFPHTFDPADPNHTEDVNLQDRILKEGSGFLEWLKASFLQYLEDGSKLYQSESMEALKRSERDDDDYSVGTYIKDRKETGLIWDLPGADLKVCAPVTKLYADYLTWCDAFDVPRSTRLGRGKFSKAVQALGYITGTYQTTRYVGLVSEQLANSK